MTSTDAPNYSVLELIYRDALQMSATEGDAEDLSAAWREGDAATIAEYAQARQGIYGVLLDDYPGVDAPFISEEMDAALSEAWGVYAAEL
jgi:hypothetical protein